MTPLSEFLEIVRSRSFFPTPAGLTVARAPGRLDVMGGIADYSGSLVLQKTIAEATFAAVLPTNDARIDILSLSADGERAFTLELPDIVRNDAPISYADARRLFGASDRDRWVAYVAGVFVVLMHELKFVFSRGAKLLIASAVPEGKGVASSAALEVATMQALAGAFRIPLAAQALAIRCQMLENLIVGAPCGLMDQMACACGEENALMAMLCQPDQLQDPVHVPHEISFWGLDSGERHAVSGSDYGAVRTGAFMGYRIIEQAGDNGRAYLANLTPSDFEKKYAHLLPIEMAGAEFLNRYGKTADTVTSVDPSRTYKVRQPTAHPIYEHDRVRRFRDLLLGPSSEEQWTLLGELMYESHASYSECGLGSRGTDLLVDLVRAEGAAGGLYGARITGGGSGGTVAVLGRADAAFAIARVREKYSEATGYRPHVFEGSSPGSARFGAMRLNI